MKRFIKTLSAFTLIFCILFTASFFYRIERTRNISWNLPKEIHTLFMGASHIHHGINDTIFKGSINLAHTSERYLFTYLKMKNILENNNHIDTIFLEFAPTDIWENTDYKYYSANEMSFFLPLYFPYFTKDEWNIYANMDKLQVATLLIQKVLKDIPQSMYSFGRFAPLNHIFDREKDKYQGGTFIEKGNSINYEYLKKIIHLCKVKDLKLYFLYMPMYNPQEFYDQDYFYNEYKNHFSEVDLLDYCNWNCPDYYRADEHHLNIHGANNFTTYLFNDSSLKKESSILKIAKKTINKNPTHIDMGMLSGK